MARRNKALSGTPSLWPSLEREEYSYASTFEGGEGPVVAYVSPQEQRIQGGDLTKLYATMVQGEEFIVLPVPKDKVPDPKPVPDPIPYVPPVKRPAPNPGRQFYPALLRLTLIPFMLINPILLELETNLGRLPPGETAI